MMPIPACSGPGFGARGVVSGLVLTLALATAPLRGQPEPTLRGDAEAVADALAMVERMGGVAIWRELGSVHFVHEWELYQRPDVYLEHETLDLTAPRSYVTMESEVYNRIRAYSPEDGYWNVVDGALSFAEEKALADALERAPYNLYRLARAVASGDERYRVTYGPMKDLPEVRALEFRGPDDAVHGWVLLNTRKEPVIWSTTQYSYALGPLQRYGSLWVPAWGVTGQGRVRYRMISLSADREPPDPALFVPPGGEGGGR